MTIADSGVLFLLLVAQRIADDISQLIEAAERISVAILVSEVI